MGPGADFRGSSSQRGGAPACPPGALSHALAELGLPDAPAAPNVRAVEIALHPRQAARRLLDRRRLVFLDSSLPDGERGRHSYVAADPFLVVRGRGRHVELETPLKTVTVAADPLDVVQRLLQLWRVDPVRDLPPFLGGAIGCFSYGLGRGGSAPHPHLVEEAGESPDLDLGFYDRVVAADHLTGRNWLIETEMPGSRERRAASRTPEMRDLIARSDASSPVAGMPPRRLRSNVGRADYLAAVRRAQAYLAAGDIYQVNLSHRLEGEWRGPTWPLYERLRLASPAPFGAYLALGGTTMLGASPERFLHLDSRTRRAETRPIKGTRPRGATPDEDRALADELRTSEKDRAENLMIADLMRNDLGKVCEIGTIRVPELFSLEGFATVWQMVSAVTGTLRPELDAIDLVRACFPGGSVTGCPKIRAMEIIGELEPAPRGFYCGAIGYVGFSGAMDTSIVIRTLVCAGDRVYLQVGGAIVADSDPDAEYAETLAKARAGLHALAAEVEEC
ncbi:MAG: aminodeoxychorismate synthase component I [Thermomicrobiales bacterium]